MKEQKRSDIPTPEQGKKIEELVALFAEKKLTMQELHLENYKVRNALAPQQSD